jgi:hypothetical protein
LTLGLAVFIYIILATTQMLSTFLSYINCLKLKITIDSQFHLTWFTGCVWLHIKFKTISKYRLNDEEWKELLGAIDKMFPEFTYEVQAKLKKISEPMLRVCYLMKIGLTGPQIANLTDYPRQTVWVRIKKIEQIMNMNEMQELKK